jgi:hypothetical protein
MFYGYQFALEVAAPKIKGVEARQSWQQSLGAEFHCGHLSLHIIINASSSPSSSSSKEKSSLRYSGPSRKALS